MKIALVTAIAAFALDEDLAPLQQALQANGIEAPILAWDDTSVSWARFDAAVLRSPWDYAERLPEFLAWAERIGEKTKLLNPLPVIRHNTDKHYLDELRRANVPVVPSRFAEPGEDAAKAVRNFLADFPDAAEFVAKPAIGAGSRDAQRYSRAQQAAAEKHVARLLSEDRSVLLQPYLPAVDEAGETALMFFDGQFSHAIRKGPLLRRDEGPTELLFAPEEITARKPGKDELQVAKAALAALPKLFGNKGPLAYARVDLIRDQSGAPVLLELELTEPSLFFLHDAKAADKFAKSLKKRLA
ncbi:ATP-grasp domain-containing protein [Arenimonas sp.]|uniref:ATP-grasp domain-containing protein n=1 Tax=Arenimonas sp. TaxID=1872635 RepID=UPI0039E22386